jgi:hypothetical protein
VRITVGTVPSSVFSWARSFSFSLRFFMNQIPV